MKYFLTSDKVQAQSMLDRFDVAFGYPNGNAQRYGEIIHPYSQTETRVAVFLEDRCIPLLGAAELSNCLPALPKTFEVPMPSI